MVSMTGYGRAQQVVGGRDITIEARSVNHRYFEFSMRGSRSYTYLEDKVKKRLQETVSRGKVEVNLTVVLQEGVAADVQLNGALAESYLSALGELAGRTGLENDLKLSDMTRFSDIFTVCKAAEDEERVWTDVCAVLDSAVERFNAMRRTEGQRMREDMQGRLAVIRGLLEEVRTAAPGTVRDYRERLYNKLKEVLENSQIDEQRLLTEAAIFAEKIAVDEETVRLESHLDQFGGICATDAAVGRKLDFLLQEMNREVNTIGSKAQDAKLARLVVEMKSEIEKIREQVQNIE